MSKNVEVLSKMSVNVSTNYCELEWNRLAKILQVFFYQLLLRQQKKCFLHFALKQIMQCDIKSPIKQPNLTQYNQNLKCWNLMFFLVA